MSVLQHDRFGLILRGFAKKPEQVSGLVDQLLSTAKQAAELKVHGLYVYSEIMILIASDSAYPDCDCGETFPAVRNGLRGLTENSRKIHVHEVDHGDLFCGVLNYGVSKLVRKRIDFVTILSFGAAQYLTESTMVKVIDAFDAGAKVVGVAISELAQSIREGRVANTFATWDTLALQSAGGFDLRAEQARTDDRTATFVHGCKDGLPVSYALQGVEEIIPLGRLVKAWGKCIAVITPDGAPEWVVPDRATDPEGWRREMSKMGTKFQRQAALAASINMDLDFLTTGVMDF